MADRGCLRLPLRACSDEVNKEMDFHKEAAVIFTQVLSEKGAMACQPTMENFRTGCKLNPPAEFTPETLAEEKKQLKLLLRIAYIRFCTWISKICPKLNVFSEKNDPGFHKLIIAKGFQSILVHSLMYYDLEQQSFKIPIDDAHRMKVTKRSLEKVFNMDLSQFELLYKFKPVDGLGVSAQDFWRLNPELRSILSASFFFDGSNVDGAGSDVFEAQKKRATNLLHNILTPEKTAEVMKLVDGLSKTRDSVMDHIKDFLADDAYLKHIFRPC